MDVPDVRQAVQGFRERTAHGTAIEHCFAPWYLQQAFHISETQALEQSSDGGYDFGIDAYHFEGDPPSNLILVQAKFSESINHISSAYKDLERSLPELARAIEGIPTEIPVQNKVLVNLRADLNRLLPEIRHKLKIEFQVLHLSTEDTAIIGKRIRETKIRFREAVEAHLPENVCVYRELGPAEFGPPKEVVAPPLSSVLHLDAMGEFETNGTKMYHGVGRLADLVDLYTSRRDDLFSRNVRYYLFSKRNVERGPAGKMRETLKKACVEGTIDPGIFAVYHNGVTLWSSRVEALNGTIRLREPYVLNGCQTIKNAFFFRNDPNLKGKVLEERWRQIPVPLRVIETNDDGLVRTVTVNNNRQNAIQPSALRANDPIQIRLQESFRERRIYYERQEGAYANLETTSPELLEDEYWNTRGRAVQIDDLAKSIAATAGEITYAEHANDLFEIDAAYDRCFSEKRLASISLLVFLQNVHDILGVVLKKDLNFSPREGAPKPSKLKHYTMCLLLRYLAKTGQFDFVAHYGDALYARDRNFRQDIGTILRSLKSGIRNELSRSFMSLESSDAQALRTAFDHVQRALRLKSDIDPFYVFGDLDERVVETKEN